MLLAQRYIGSVAKKAPTMPILRALSQATPSPPSQLQQDATDSNIAKVVVFGGSGFVGQSVCQAALRLGAEVVSINRSGAPAGKANDWAGNVRWVKADMFNPSEYATELSGAKGVVSCVGGFGSNEQMEKLCGDATVMATEAAEKAGVERFVFISAAGAQHEHPLLSGYWKGKRKAEAAILERFQDRGVILRASGIYGNRKVGSLTVPLGVFMQPLEMLLNLPPFSRLRNAGPLEPMLTPPVAVETVGTVAAGGALGLVPGGVLLVDDIKRLRAEL